MSGRGDWSFVYLSSSIAAVLFLSVIFLTVCSVSDDSSADPQPLPYSEVTWDLDTTTGTLTIGGHGAMPDFNNYDNIAPWRTDENRPHVHRVVIGDEVTSIGAYAFYECNFMDTLIVGDSVNSIGDYSFFNCILLSDLDLGDSVTTIGTHAFGGCIGIRTLIIPDSVTTIGHNAFNGCSELTDLSFPLALLTVEEDAFSPWNFVDNVGPVVVNADNLKGKEFTLVTGYFQIQDDVRVIFDTEGGSSIDSVLVVYNTPADRPADPTKTAYGFVDWYSDRYLTSAYDFDGNVTTRTTLHAKWNPLPYSITYHTYDEYTDTTANPVVYTI